MNIYLTLFGIFFKVGLFSFGGGNAMLPLIYQSLQQTGVMSAEEFSDLVALSQVTPGPVAVNAATFAGLESSDMLGAVIATIAVCIPCFVIMLIVVRMLDRFKNNRIVEGAFAGIRPATIGLIAAAVVFIAGGVLVKGPMASFDMADISYYNFVPICIFAVSIMLIQIFKFRPIWVMLIMAFAGALLYGTGLVPMA